MTDNNNDTDSDIDKLTAELEELTIQRNNIERRRSRVSEQLQKLKKRRSDEYTLYKKLTVVANRVDSKGNPLRVGDKVRFDTPGVQTTPHGKVKGFGKRFVKCVDDRRFPVNKEPKSLTRVDVKEDSA